ncbi:MULTISPECIES: flagellar basal body rod protein FlgF [unclassified Burkholderia]|uniref:flagellar basal body rod protein FlgF n=1 Tax=unclassified Burkholderia TaxID=2613784 RepID=UPI0007583D52|nr:MULTISPECIES: flagellar basal body rod protein FlgF [unclassified Burkholderia]KUY99841.1 flagellar biosynthesis protein FlgF [Burkholderia sp. RF7-non_BP1]KUZ03976.1 flagellar biosynthesis protein FlgF [Burkholderia sp. RF7-non_BP4]
MDALIYTAMSGADRAWHGLEVHANNLANAQTDGFRAELEMAQSRAVRGYGYDSRHLAKPESGAVSGRAGVLAETGRELDAAIQGGGYFTVADANGVRYTRAGNFEIDADGALTVNGRAVIGEGGPIVLPEFTSLRIGEDGTISVTAPGDADVQAVDRLALVDAPAADLVKDPAGLLVARDGQPLPPAEDVRVMGGHLERSNVSPVAEMIATMSLNRAFEVQMRMFGAAGEMADAGNRLIRG